MKNFFTCLTLDILKGKVWTHRSDCTQYCALFPWWRSGRWEDIPPAACDTPRSYILQQRRRTARPRRSTPARAPAPPGRSADRRTGGSYTHEPFQQRSLFTRLIGVQTRFPLTECNLIIPESRYSTHSLTHHHMLYSLVMIQQKQQQLVYSDCQFRFLIVFFPKEWKWKNKINSTFLHMCEK